MEKKQRRAFQACFFVLFMAMSLTVASHAQVQCWAPRVEEGAPRNPKWPNLLQALITTDDIVHKNAAFMEQKVPVRMRTTISAGPYADTGASLITQAYPERTSVGIRVWTGKCGVISAADRVNAGRNGVFMHFNSTLDDEIINTKTGPKLTGHVAGFPEYNGWVVISKGGRLPWLPVTVKEVLEKEGLRREKELVDCKADRNARDCSVEPVTNYRHYLASFTPEQLRAPAVYKQDMRTFTDNADKHLQSLNQLTPDEQRQVEAWERQSSDLDHQARVAAFNKNPQEAARLRAESEQVYAKAATVRKHRREMAADTAITAPISDWLSNVGPGRAENAIRWKQDPAFPDFKDPNRIQVIIVRVTSSDDKLLTEPDAVPTEPSAWSKHVRDTLDYAALASLIR